MTDWEIRFIPKTKRRRRNSKRIQQENEYSKKRKKRKKVQLRGKDKLEHGEHIQRTSDVNEISPARIRQTQAHS